MGIKVHNIDHRSVLARKEINFSIGVTATGACVDSFIVPYACSLEKLKYATALGISATAGDAMHIIVNDPYGSKTMIDSTLTGTVAGIAAHVGTVISASTIYNLTQGTPITINASGTAAFGKFYGSLILKINSTLER